MTIECVFCKGTGVDPDGARCTWCDATGIEQGLSSAVTIERDDAADVVTIERITYSQQLFRQLGGLMPVNQAFRLVARSIGAYGNTLTIETIDSPDAALAREAALREELAEIKESLAYRGSLLNRTQLRAEAAEQRNSVLRGLLEEALGSVYVEARRAETAFASRLHTGLADRIEAALKPTESVGWKVWGEDRCDHCCNKDRCDDSSHFERSQCPYCKGTGNAIWLTKPTESGASE